MTQNNRTYTKFTKHINNAESVNANDINAAQDAINLAQENLIDVGDKLFVDKFLFMFSNNPDVNSVYIDDLQAEQQLLLNSSSNVAYHLYEKNVALVSGASSGFVLSGDIYGKSDGGINSLRLSLDAYQPKGSFISASVIAGKNEYPIVFNNTSGLLVLPACVSVFKIKIYLKANAAMASPKIYAMGMMYRDEAIHNGYGLTNPDLSVFDQVELGGTQLVRENGRLVRLIEPSMDTQILYGESGNIEQVIEDNGSVRRTYTLTYGEVSTADGETGTGVVAFTTALV